jgi:predicted metal-binding membrane protein
MFLQQRSSRAFFGISTLVFAASTTLTIAWCRSMAAMHAMLMPGGWSMSMMWMRMPGQSWPGAATSFLRMWLVMMLAMMLPSLLPMLSRYRAQVIAEGPRLDALTALVAAAYFTVWMLFGAIVFVIGTALAQLEMEFPFFARMVPMAIGATVLIAAALQFSAWKRHHLACCRRTPCCDALAADAGTAWRHGLRLGMHCVHCCFGLTAILLVVGMMDLRAMALVTAAISAERLFPRGERAVKLIGVVLTIAGCIQIARAALA